MPAAVLSADKPWRTDLLPPEATQSDIAYLKKVYGFDKPVPVQYLKWVARASVGPCAAAPDLRLTDPPRAAYYRREAR